MVIAILTVIVGGITILTLPVAQFPNIVPPETKIQATFVGADAQTLAQSVATPIEEQMSGVDNMNYMYSVNATANGQTTMIVDFAVGTDPNTDLILTQMRETQAAAQWPSQVANYGVTVQKSTSAPLMLVALYSPHGTYNAQFLANYAYINLDDPITRVPGVANVQVFGAGQYAMRIWLKPDALARLDITVSDVISAIQSQNTVNPAGQIGGQPAPPGQEFTDSERAQGRLVTPQQFGDIVVRENPDGGVVRVKDVAQVELGTQYYTLMGRLNGKPSAVIAIYQLPGSNAVNTAAGVKKLMAQLKGRFPQDMSYAISLDQTRAVTEGIKEILITLLIALALVILVVYIFLQGWRATLIPLLAVPVALIGTFAVFPLFGFSINTLSMFGLVLAIGLVVDDAIVVVEAVERHIEEGLAPKEAALRAMEEISGPVIGIALVLSSVFVPTAFIPGITGRLYQQFAVTIAVSVIISAFNALSLSPALCSLLLKPAHESKGLLHKAFGGFNRLFEKATNGYVGISGALIRKMGLSFGLLAGVAGAAFLVENRLPSGLLPTEDLGYFYLNIQLPDAASLQRTDAFTKEVESVLKHTNGVQYYSTIVGSSLLTQTNATYSAFVFVALKPWGERKTEETSVRSIMESVNDRLDRLPAGRAFAFSPPAISGVGTSGGFSFMLEDRVGKDVPYLAENTDRFLEAARKRPELTRLHSSLYAQVPQVIVEVDRDKVLKQGVEVDDVYSTLRAFMGSLFVNYFNRFGRAWQVYIGAEKGYRTEAKEVMNFYVRNKDNQMLP